MGFHGGGRQPLAGNSAVRAASRAVLPGPAPHGPSVSRKTFHACTHATSCPGRSRVAHGMAFWDTYILVGSCCDMAIEDDNCFHYGRSAHNITRRLPTQGSGIRQPVVHYPVSLPQCS
eukprot:257138-Chlamydomonas_euryale.AAC.2